MSWLTLSRVAAMTSGGLLGEEAQLNAVSIDTRKVKADDLFIAIKGERFDGHDFVGDLSGKVAAALVSKEIQCDVPQVLVKDTKLALIELAAAWRNHFKKPVIGLTGSNGKTTLKEMVSAILSRRGKVLATRGNFNNDIGMPLTLLRIREEHDFAVIEMGANHFGEIEFLSGIAKPDIAVVNNSGAAHLEGFGDVKGVAKAKGEIFDSLTENGVAVVNADDEYAEYWLKLNAKQAGRKIVRFGMDNEAEIRGSYLGNGRLVINADKGQSEQEVQLNLLGRHNAMNALAATAVVSELGVDLQTVKEGLESLESVPGRLARVEVEAMEGITLIDDTYNANPDSTHAAIDVLAEANNTRILVLGDMAELGEDADSMHAGIGVKAKQMGIEYLFCLGEYSASACREFGNPEGASTELEALVNSIKNTIKNESKNAMELSNVTILVKGSRSARMERVVYALKDALKNAGGTASC